MTRFLVTALAVAACLHLPLCLGEPTETTAEIEAILEAYASAEEALDAQAIMNLMSRDPGLTSITQGRILRGREAIQHETELAAQPHRPPDITLNEVAIRLLGPNHALAVAEYSIGVSLTSGPIEFSRAWTVVLERVSGDWKILHEHHSSR